MKGYTTLERLLPGSLFVTEDGTFAVKTKYHYDGNDPQWECILLESGEMAHFPQGNRTLVKKIPLSKIKEIAHG